MYKCYRADIDLMDEDDENDDENEEEEEEEEEGDEEDGEEQSRDQVDDETEGEDDIISLAEETGAAQLPVNSAAQGKDYSV